MNRLREAGSFGEAAAFGMGSVVRLMPLFVSGRSGGSIINGGLGWNVSEEAVR
jgi:hypothetical protein